VVNTIRRKEDVAPTLGFGAHFLVIGGDFRNSGHADRFLGRSSSLRAHPTSTHAHQARKTRDLSFRSSSNATHRLHEHQILPSEKNSHTPALTQNHTYTNGPKPTHGNHESPSLADVYAVTEATRHPAPSTGASDLPILKGYLGQEESFRGKHAFQGKAVRRGFASEKGLWVDF
jgi:hypothetical protein